MDMGAVEFSGLRVTSPNPNAFTLRPAFTWTPIAGATSYSIQINNESTGVAQFHLGTSNSSTYTPSVDLAIGKFKMWVRPNFAADPGNWSVPHLFNNLTPPTWTTMSRAQLTSRPTLIWNALPGAVKYDLWMDNFSTGQKALIRQDVTGTSFTPAADLSIGIYRFWIRGVDAKGNFASWSVLQEFLVVPGPAPVGPLSASFDRTPTFTWSPVTGAASYEIYVKNQNTGVFVINGQGTATTNFTPVSNLADGPYRWWVLAVGPGGLKSGGATTTDIYVGGRSTVLGPIGNTTNTTPTFTWKLVLGAASYQLSVNRIDVPQAGIISVTGILGTNFTPTTVLPKGTYRVWVRAFSTTAELSIWSVQVDFTITAIEPTVELWNADSLFTGLLVSELIQFDAVNSDPKPAVSNPPGSMVSETETEDQSSAGEHSWVQIAPLQESAVALTVVRSPSAPDLDNLMAEYALHEF